MRINCRISGLSVVVPQFAGQCIANVHPIFTMPLPALHKLARKDCSTTDESLLLLAYVWQTGLAQFCAPLPPDSILPATVQMWLPQMPRIVDECRRSTKGLPAFHWSADKSERSSLTQWLTVLSDAIADSLRDNRSYFAREERAIRRVTAIRRRSAAMQFDSVLHWAGDYLFARCPEFGACDKRKDETQEQFLAREERTKRRALQELKAACAIGNGNITPLSMLKMHRTRCAEYLPTEDDNQQAKVELILARLDAAILRKIDFFQSLGAAPDSETEALLATITTNYVIDMGEDSEPIINRANDGAEALASIQGRARDGSMAGMLAQLDAAIDAMRDAPEPQRADFASQLAYQAALMKWKAAKNKRA